jgi:hypothetical protein
MTPPNREGAYGVADMKRRLLPPLIEAAAAIERDVAARRVIASA